MFFRAGEKMSIFLKFDVQLFGTQISKYYCSYSKVSRKYETRIWEVEGIVNEIQVPVEMPTFKLGSKLQHLSADPAQRLRMFHKI